MLSPQDWHARFSQQARWTAPLREYLFAQLDLAGARRLLEVGCGTGALLSEWMQPSFWQGGIQIHGLDLDAAFLSLAGGHAPGAHLTCGDAHQLPYACASFDLVACHFLLMWVQSPQQVVVEMKRLARPGGAVLLLAEPDYGGRIDYPEELVQLGAWQEEALVRQGADTRMGRRLGALLVAAGLVEVETGVLGGQWRGAPALQVWQSEWQVLYADLESHVDRQQLRRLQKIDETASQHSQRVLYVPTFYAWGRVSINRV